MTVSLAVNANNDIYRDASGNIALVSGIAAAAQDSKNAVSVVLGEYLFDTTLGLPYDAALWSQFRPAQFEAAARATLLKVPGVLSVLNFNLTRSGTIAAYSATLKTIYGFPIIQGVIPNV